MGFRSRHCKYFKTGILFSVQIILFDERYLSSDILQLSETYGPVIQRILHSNKFIQGDSLTTWKQFNCVFIFTLLCTWSNWFKCPIIYSWDDEDEDHHHHHHQIHWQAKVPFCYQKDIINTFPSLIFAVTLKAIIIIDRSYNRFIT